jgi:hypothetical protein
MDITLPSAYLTSIKAAAPEPAGQAPFGAIRAGRQSARDARIKHLKSMANLPIHLTFYDKLEPRHLILSDN